MSAPSTYSVGRDQRTRMPVDWVVSESSCTGFGATSWGGFGIVLRPHAPRPSASTTQVTPIGSARRMSEASQAARDVRRRGSAARDAAAEGGVLRQPVFQVRTECLRELLPLLRRQALE